MQARVLADERPILTVEYIVEDQAKQTATQMIGCVSKYELADAGVFSNKYSVANTLKKKYVKPS